MHAGCWRERKNGCPTKEAPRSNNGGGSTTATVEPMDASPVDAVREDKANERMDSDVLGDRPSDG